MTNASIPIVIGRRGVDNILITRHKDKCELCKALIVIDGTPSITGIHIGVSSFRKRTRLLSYRDKEWNMEVRKNASVPLGGLRHSSFSLYNDGSFNLSKVHCACLLPLFVFTGYSLTRPFHLSYSLIVTIHATTTRCAVFNKNIRKRPTR